MKKKLLAFARKIETKIDKFALKIEKRLRFVISTLILTGLVLISTFFFFDNAWIFIPILIIATYVLTYFSIIEGVEDIEWLTLFLMPVVFTVAFYVFYFLFPVRWLTRIPFIAIYGISIYAILLTTNIFNVGVEKNLQLYRAAFSTNYFYQTIIAFLIFNAVFSLRENFIVNTIFAGGVGFILSLQLLWSIKLDRHLDKNLILFAGLIGGILAEGALIFSFVPFEVTIASLVLTSSYYSLTGLVYSYLDGRLFKETVREYLVVLGVVAAIAALSLKW